MMRIEGEGQGLLGKLLRLAAGTAMLILVFTLSLMLFVAVVAGGMLVWAYLWWRTQKLRGELRQQMREPPPSGRVIEGEAIRESGSDERDERGNH